MSVKGFVGTLATALLLFLLTVTGVARADEEPGVGPVQQTPLGEITGSDTELLVKVRQAGLWEMPMGEEAQTRAASQRVKDVGLQLAADHVFLDERVMKLAEGMGVTLPDVASVDQQSWMAEMRSQTGAEFDETFANRLRAAHGAVFSAVAKVRAGTRNDAIRQFAQVCINIVMKHMTLLESTNLVAEPGLSAPKRAGADGASADPTLAASQQNLLTSGTTPLLILAMCAVGAATTMGILRLLRPRSTMR